MRKPSLNMFPMSGYTRLVGPPFLSTTFNAQDIAPVILGRTFSFVPWNTETTIILEDNELLTELSSRPGGLHGRMNFYYCSCSPNVTASPRSFYGSIANEIDKFLAGA